MDYSEIISQTFDVFKKNFKDIIIVFLIIFLIFLVIESLFSFDTVKEVQTEYYNEDGNKIKEITKEIGGTNTGKLGIFDLVIEFLKQIIYGANFMALLAFLRGGEYNIRTVYEKGLNNIRILAPVAGIYALIIYILGVIPIIGPLLSLIASIALAFVYFEIEDFEGDSPIDFFKLSYKMTYGHKMNIFILNLILQIIPILILVVLIVLLISSLIGLVIGAFLGIIVLPLIVGIISTLLYSIGLTIYYDKLLDDVYLS